MDALHGWSKKAVFLKNKWSYILITVTLVAMMYPLIVLSIGKDEWMDCFVEFCPFFVPTLILVVWCSHFITNPNFADLIPGLVFYLFWVTESLSIMFSACGKRAYRFIAYLLLSIDVVCNLFVLHLRYLAIFIDAILILLLSLCFSDTGAKETALLSSKDQDNSTN